MRSDRQIMILSDGETFTGLEGCEIWTLSDKGLDFLADTDIKDIPQEEISRCERFEYGKWRVVPIQDEEEREDWPKHWKK